MSRQGRTAACPRSRGARRERGAVAVEFALVLPLLVTLLIGAVTVAVAYSQSLGLTNAVREGARFGASADAVSSSWAADVIARVRATQFDDAASTPETSVCVQLYKQGTGVVKSACDQAGGPALAISDASSVPQVPAGLPTDTCVVRVVAARAYQITIVFAPIPAGTAVRGSVARYEREC